ncbi:hypothetical protein HK104_006083 [Borealophlyctis nickersoniae]|nr:hypothetical protein HK104_006083 [Borealophlyctis nickersoniae]
MANNMPVNTALADAAQFGFSYPSAQAPVCISVPWLSIPEWVTSSEAFVSTLSQNLPPKVIDTIHIHEYEPSTVVNVLLFLSFIIFLFIRQRFWIRCKVVLHHAEETVPINYTDGKSGEIKTVPLRTLVDEWCPALVREPGNTFSPTPWLPNGHLQTIWAAMIADFAVQKVTYEREKILFPDGGNAALDWCPGPSTHPFDATPTIVILHGLTGGSHETYVQDVVDVVVRCRGYRAVVCNFRGCAKTELTTAQLYSAGYTDDLDYAVGYIKKKCPGAPLFGIGFSLGANVLTKYVGETGTDCPFVGACAVANPFDLLAGARALDRTWLGRNIYSPRLGQNLIKMFRKHMHHFQDTLRVTPKTLSTVRTITEFDDLVTRRAFNFRTVHEYYRRNSSAQFVPDIAIPTLLLSALDDPVVPKEAIPLYEAEANGNVILATTERGGHLGWFEGTGVWGMPKRWNPEPVAQFVTAIVEAWSSLPPDMRRKSGTGSGTGKVVRWVKNGGHGGSSVGLSPVKTSPPPFKSRYKGTRQQSIQRDIVAMAEKELGKIAETSAGPASPTTTTAAAVAKEPAASSPAPSALSPSSTAVATRGSQTLIKPAPETLTILSTLRLLWYLLTLLRPIKRGRINRATVVAALAAAAGIYVRRRNANKFVFI